MNPDEENESSLFQCLYTEKAIPQFSYSLMQYFVNIACLTGEGEFIFNEDEVMCNSMSGFPCNKL